ncbi:hypothetical protein AAHE18_14G236300 [Arachis hypogaea]
MMGTVLFYCFGLLFSSSTASVSFSCSLISQHHWELQLPHQHRPLPSSSYSFSYWPNPLSHFPCCFLQLHWQLVEKPRLSVFQRSKLSTSLSWIILPLWAVESTRLLRE